jgi:hypothetical protein
MANGMAVTEWVEYPLSVKLSKWVCLLALIGVAIAYIGSLWPIYQEFGVIGLWYAATNWTNLIFLPVMALCFTGIMLKG